jgi:hypothetical protein
MLSYKYTITTLNEEFLFENGNKSPKTVIVKFVDDDGDEIKNKKFGFIEPSTIYEKIDNNEPIDLDFAYLNNFSLHDYRESRKKDERSYVQFNTFSAQHAFFDCENRVDFAFSQFNESFDIQHAVFAKGYINFYKSVYNKEVNFSEVNFGKGEADFHFSEFGNYDTNFEKSTFPSGDLTFVNCNFGDGTINFSQVNFGDGNADFHFSNFGKGLVTFDKAIFGGGEINFKRISFGEGKVEFRRVDFGNGNVFFDESEIIKGKMSFRSAKLGSGDISFNLFDFGNNQVIFDNSYFGTGKVSLFRTKSKSISFVGCHLDSYMDLRIEECETINLSDTIIRDIVDFRIHNAPVKIGKLICSQMRNLGQIYLSWNENDCLKLLTSDADDYHRDMSNQYRVFKENFNNLGQYDDEDSSYVQFKSHELKADIKDHLKRNPANAIWVYPYSGFQWLVFDKMGKYATDPIRVLISTLIIYILFSLQYYYLPFFANAEIVQSVVHPDHMNHGLAEAFYHSAVTFLTIGYGDFYPSGHFKWISAFEGFVGLFLMSYFTVAFVRKILR